MILMIVVEWYPCEMIITIHHHHSAATAVYDMELYSQPSFGERQDGGDNYFLAYVSLHYLIMFNNNIQPPWWYYEEAKKAAGFELSNGMTAQQIEDKV